MGIGFELRIKDIDRISGFKKDHYIHNYLPLALETTSI